MATSRSIAITHAHVVPIEGEPYDGTVVVTDGRISAAGKRAKVPRKAEVMAWPPKPPAPGAREVALAFNLLLARIQRISRSRRRAVHHDFDDDEIQEAVDA